jgi:hypothetical protein
MPQSFPRRIQSEAIINDHFSPIRPIEFSCDNGQNTGYDFPNEQHHFRRRASNFTVDPARTCCDFPL